MHPTPMPLSWPKVLSLSSSVASSSPLPQSKIENAAEATPYCMVLLHEAISQCTYRDDPLLSQSRKAAGEGSRLLWGLGHGEECPGCGHLSTFLCPPISHTLLLLACLVTPLLIHLISVHSPGKPAFYNYYRAGSAAADLGRKGTEPEAIPGLVVSGNSERGFLGAPSHCRGNQPAALKGVQQPLIPDPQTERSTWRAA